MCDIYEEEVNMHNITLPEGQCRRLRRAIGERVYQLTANGQAQGPIYKALYSAINEHYNVESYSKIPSSKLQEALRFIAYWKG